MKFKEYNIYRKSFPYYKVQYWDNKVNAWHDIQKRFNNPIEAKLHGESSGLLTRVMVINRDSRIVYDNQGK